MNIPLKALDLREILYIILIQGMMPQRLNHVALKKRMVTNDAY